MKMEWRITERRDGFMAEYGGYVGGGFIMPAFIVYEAHHFGTRRQAERYIKNRGGSVK